MKVVGLLILGCSLAYAQKDCPTWEPMKCGPEDQSCYGGKDMDGCQMPDFCYPMKGSMGKDGTECPFTCPTKCGLKKKHVGKDLILTIATFQIFVSQQKDQLE